MKTEFDWSELAFESKKPLKELTAIFIAAPRQISRQRFIQLVKRYLPKGNIVIGLAKESYVLGFEDQPQFRMLQLADIESILQKVNASSSQHTITILHYNQREQKHIIEKLNFQQAVFINGSWKYTFHTSETFYALVNMKIPYVQVSPFVDEAEALAYEMEITPRLHATYDSQLRVGQDLDEVEMLARARIVSSFSFDHSYQTGVALGKKHARTNQYTLLATAFNKVVPYQTYAWHYGPAREVNYSPPSDLNHYDAVHAEVEMIIQAAKSGIDLMGTTLFINLLPCPSCARMLAETDIAEFIYTEDHSAGYAIQMLEKAGKTVRRVVLHEIKQKED